MVLSAKLENLKTRVNEMVATAQAAREENREQLTLRVDKAEQDANQAMQDASGYPPLAARTRLAKQAVRTEKVAAVVMLAVPIVMVLAKAPHVVLIEVMVGVMIFALSILLHAVTLPVEFDASFGRALPVLKAGRYLDDKDMPAAKEILRAAAFTYVAAAAMSVLDVMRWLRVLRI